MFNCGKYHTQLESYADDVVIMSRDRRTLRKKIAKISKEAQKTALEINHRKSKYIEVNRSESHRAAVKEQ